MLNSPLPSVPRQLVQNNFKVKMRPREVKLTYIILAAILEKSLIIPKD